MIIDLANNTGKIFSAFKKDSIPEYKEFGLIFLLFTVLLIIFSQNLHAQYEHVLPLENYDLNTFEGRANLILESVADYGEKNGIWTDAKNGAYPAIALFATGNIEMGRQFARDQLTGSGAMFREFGNMILYMKCGHLYDQELRDLVKDDQLNHSTLYSETERGNLPGSSENHKLMYAAANYLGGLAWPDEYPELWYNAGYDYLMNWFEIVTSQGYWEDDSPTYFVHHIGPILSVMEFAPDSSLMKQKATMAFEWYMAGVAAEYLKGYWITPSARDYVPVHGLHLSEETIATLWLYFGDTGNRIPHPHPTSGHEPFRHWYCAVHFANSDYRLPEPFINIAKVRDEPYAFKEYLAKNPMRPSEYGYINKYYGLTAMVADSGNPPPDMTRWKLQWVPDEAEMEPCVFLMKHPMPTEDDGWKNWEGASPYEQVYQHENTLIAMYDIPADDVHPFIDGPLDSAVYRYVMQKDDWWFFHAGELLFGVYAENGLYVTGEKRIAYDHFGDAALTGIIRSNGNKNILIVESALREDYAGGTAQDELNLFANAVLNNTILTPDLSGSFPIVEFKNLKGDWIKMEYNGERKLNNSIISFKDWPMIENPWMYQQQGGRYLSVRHEEESIIYDFEKWEKYKEEVNINLLLKMSLADTILINPGIIILEALPDKDTSIIEQVDFYINGHLTWSDSLSPYTYDWINPEPDKYEIESKLMTSVGTVKYSNKLNLIISDGTPEIKLTSPKAGKIFLLNDTLEILTETIDYDGLIDSVHFFANDSLIGKVNSEPFTWKWIKPESGYYGIQAVAWDNDQKSDSSQLTSIQLVGYSKPYEIENLKKGIIYSYFEGNWPQLPDFKNHTAVETDTVTNFVLSKRKRDFEYAFRFYGYLKIHEKGLYNFYTNSDLESKLYIDDQLFIRNSSSDQQENMTLLDKGLHKIQVEMVNNTDGQGFEIWFEGPGFEKQAIPDSMLFRSYGNQPEINLLSPPQDTIYNEGDIVNIEFAVNDLDGDDNKIILFEDIIEIAELNKYSYSASIDGFSSGIHQLRAVVYDLEGLTAESEVFTVSINSAPVFEFESPLMNAEYFAYDTIHVILSTSDKDIGKILFYLNEKLIKTINQEPWSFELYNQKQGSYFLKAIATDILGIESTIKTEFKIVNSAPEIKIVKPLDNTILPLGKAVVLEAEITDYDDDVYKVAFYENDKQIGQNANFLNQTTIYNYSEGEHVLTAKAFDRSGSISVSAPVLFRVLDVTGMENFLTDNQINIYPNPFHDGTLNVDTEFLQNENSEMKVLVNDITGRTLYLNLLDAIPAKFTIPSEVFERSGMYFLSIQCNSGIYTGKILVEKSLY